MRRLVVSCLATLCSLLILNACAPLAPQPDQAVPERAAKAVEPESTAPSEIFEIPGFDGETIYARDINVLGEVTGITRNSQGNRIAFLWTPEQGVRELGTLDGTSSRAFSINDSSEIVGISDSSSGNRHAFFWSEATGMADLGTLGGDESRALALNNTGGIVGESYLADGRYHAFYYSEETGMLDIGALENMDSTAFHILDDGTVLGYHITLTGEKYLFTWDLASGRNDLGLEERYMNFVPEVMNTQGVIGGADYENISYPVPMALKLGDRSFGVPSNLQAYLGHVDHITDENIVLGTASKRPEVDPFVFRYDPAIPSLRFITFETLTPMKVMGTTPDGKILISATNAEGITSSYLITP